MLHKEAYSYKNATNTISRKGRTTRAIGEDIVLELILGVFCFLMGRAVIFEGIAPFGAALFGTVMLRRRGVATAFIAASVGLLSYSTGGFAVKYIGALGLIFLFHQILRKSKLRWGCFHTGLGVMVSLMVSSVLYGYTRVGGILTYDLILAVFEAVIGFVMVYVLNYALGVFFEHRKRRILSNEEMISISIFISLLIIGFWDVNILGLSVRNVFSVLFVLVFAYIGGSGVGASMGLMSGLVLSLSSYSDPVLIASFGVCGLIAGTFRELGRLCVGCAFILANALITFYINKSTSVIIPFPEIAASAMLLLITPVRAVNYLKQFLDYTLVRLKEQNYYVKRMQELTVGRLKEFSRVFYQLARTFDQISDYNQVAGQEDISRLLDLIAAQVCEGCVLFGSCWKRDFYKTYSIMFDVLVAAENKGNLGKDDIPPDIAKKCLKLEEMVGVINHVYGLYRSNIRWQQQFDECRHLVARQLEGVSNVVTQLAAELDINIYFKKELEEAIQLELDKAGIRTKEVLVMEKADGKIEISISKKSCGGRRECVRKVEKIVSEVVRKPMSSKTPICAGSGKDQCILQFVEARKFQVITGVARRARQFSDRCGDSYSFSSLADGKYMLALSDGMGTGNRAAEESGAVISLLENFLEAGFNMDITIQTINSILMLRSRDEIFATADLCVIDLVNGSADFVKIGAVSTFVKRKGHVEVIKASSLPIGILDDVQLETVSLKLDDEDMIIMITDGISDSVGQGKDPDEWLANVIGSYDTRNPQELADYIIGEVLKESEDQPKDDMTVMVSRVWKPVV